MLTECSLEITENEDTRVSRRGEGAGEGEGEGEREVRVRPSQPMFVLCSAGLRLRAVCSPVGKRAPNPNAPCPPLPLHLHPPPPPKRPAAELKKERSG